MYDMRRSGRQAQRAILCTLYVYQLHTLTAHHPAEDTRNALMSFCFGTRGCEHPGRDFHPLRRHYITVSTKRQVSREDYTYNLNQTRSTHSSSTKPCVSKRFRAQRGKKRKSKSGEKKMSTIRTRAIPEK